ncbi:MAG: cytochrome C oxidase subunit IV family protein [Anaerolineales bacterium]
MDTNARQEEMEKANYGVVFLILAVFTGLEVGASYLPEPYKIPVLILLAAIKAGLVLLYFMHLKFDRRIYAILFVIGMITVIPLILAIALATPYGG